MEPIDWAKMFVPDANPLEIFIRGSIIYLALFVLLRFVLRREAGALGLTDLLVIVLLADAAQNGMAGEYRSLTEGVVIVATIFAWNYTLDWLAYRSRFVYWLLHPPSLPLIRNGVLQHRNLRSQLITRNDLMEQLREQGIDDVRHVKSCFLEGDGRMSVIREDGDQQPRPSEKRRT